MTTSTLVKCGCTMSWSKNKAKNKSLGLWFQLKKQKLQGPRASVTKCSIFRAAATTVQSHRATRIWGPNFIRHTHVWFGNSGWRFIFYFLVSRYEQGRKGAHLCVPRGPRNSLCTSPESANASPAILTRVRSCPMSCVEQSFSDARVLYNLLNWYLHI